MNREQALGFRNRFREARAAVEKTTGIRPTKAIEYDPDSGEAVFSRSIERANIEPETLHLPLIMNTLKRINTHALDHDYVLLGL